ncbi:TAT-variant-translocated molybdopterin oxidoreductase [Verrucomicrobium sp. BvORR034]|uniref:TAT-variant-translocated molybdopterin oxidoreductase n=1 Tax=Verrucomicrobium sp. BvORR034 TaxID=1396418 RepID=UPI0006790A0B|nr:TAT-variant-translocated molybdopterin oxidoreductase [Verrucomicrobium sp. BvORR034]
MKRIWQHPEVKSERRYWRSLGEYSNTPEFTEKVGREFDPSIGLESAEERENSRRDFMKIMGGIAAVAGLASCRRPQQKILPFTKHVEWIVPGKSLLYATVMPRPYGSTPMVAVTHEGRPTHLQGNPLHPTNGGLDIFAQASVLDLYSEARVKKVVGKGAPTSWSKFERELRGWWEHSWSKNGGEGLALLLSPSTSPTRAGLLTEFAKTYPKAAVYSYAPVSRANELNAVKALFGEGVSLLPNYDKAKVVFSLDADFLGVDSTTEFHTKSFMKNRGPEKGTDGMSRLYVLENRYTLTGGISDHRKPIAASLIPAAAAVLAQEVAKLTKDSALAQAAAPLAQGLSDNLRQWIAVAAADLFEDKDKDGKVLGSNLGKSIVVAGSGQSEAVHALVLAINDSLKAFGAVIDTVTVPVSKSGRIEQLTADLTAKKVKQLFILADTDPVYDAVGFADAAKASEAKIVTLALRANQTAKHSHWILPAAHYLEAWDDVRSAEGVYSVVQPMIQPLFDGASVNDMLLALLGRKHPGPARAKAVEPSKDPAAPVPAPVFEVDPAYVAVKDSFTKTAGAWDEEKWNHVLRDGFLPKTYYPKASVSLNRGAVAGLVAKAPKLSAPTEQALEIVLAPDASVFDGRYIDNPWLQEAPDPITKLTWDNAAWLSPRTFKRLGLKTDGDFIEVKVGDKTLKIAAIACPGHAHDSVTIPLGYGQKVTTYVGKGTGFNAYPLRSAVTDYIISGATVAKVEGNYELAITQETYTMEARSQVREATLETFKNDEHFASHQGMDSHIPPEMSIYKGRIGVKSEENPNGFDYENLPQWGMVIDLSKCLGCSACIVACQSENNIAVVGKDQVRKGRVMQWIRMDRYFATPDNVDSDPTLEDLDNPEMVSQPVSCQQCESAPCEAVCPVNATVHTEDGLNAMAYNRCIGTRYCANNCPYTARRFNYFDYNKRNPLIETKVLGLKTNNVYAGPLGEKKPQEMEQLQKNPNVTVRMRGVIEKCTYCVQRLEEAKINQRRIARDDSSKLLVKSESLKVACQASCAADAIVFGNLAEKDGPVAKMKEHPRNYQVLKYLGTRPRTSYLARIRNVNPMMAKLELEKDRTVPTGTSSSMERSF